APAASLSRQRDLANDLDMDCIRITEIRLPPADKDRVVARQFSPSSRRVDVTQLPWAKFECDVACFSRSKMNSLKTLKSKPRRERSGGCGEVELGHLIPFS